MTVFFPETSASTCGSGGIGDLAVHISGAPGRDFYPLPPFRLPESRRPSRAVPVAEGMIVDRGRGPEIVGTRITIYTIMEFLEYSCSIADIASELGLTERQVRAAVEYIRAHQDQSNREYELIVRRMSRPNSPEVERTRARSAEELRERIKGRLSEGGTHDPPVGQ